MPRTPDEDSLTEEQRAFVEHYAAQGFKDAKAAALLAGYAESVADHATREVLRSPSVRRAVEDAKEAFRQELRDELVGEAKKSVKVIQAIRDDEEFNVFARLGAAKEILEKAGVVTMQAVQEQGTKRIVVTYEREKEDADDRG